MAELGVHRSAWYLYILAITFLSCFSALPLAAQGNDKPCGSACVVNKYVGAGSCGASACHGAPSPRCSERILLNEYRTWALYDPHFKAAAILETPPAPSAPHDRRESALVDSQRLSQQIAGVLNAQRGQSEKISPATSPKCLVCHGLAPATSQKERDFDKEGVGCESCHGPASGWLEPHIRKDRKDWIPPKYVPLGMYNFSNVTLYARQCLNCHLGSGKAYQVGNKTEYQEVDHEMIAAGHPDLLFELDLFSARQPAHWKRPDSGGGVRLWAVGQAVQLREALGRLQRRAGRGSWPEFSELDCFSCHHGLAKPDRNWRQQREFTNRGAGSPPWNVAHYLLFRILLEQDLVTDQPLLANLEAALRKVAEVTGNRNSPAKDVADSAMHAEKLADDFVNKLERVDKSKFDKALAAHLLRRISEQGNIISEDTRSAEQAWMALDTLFRYYDGYEKPRPSGAITADGFCADEKTPGAHSPVYAALDRLFREFDNPSAYDGQRFAVEMQQVGAALRKAGIGQ